MAMAIDPVCKMKVDESQPAATSEYKGKKSFDKNPEKYLGVCGPGSKCSC